MASVHRFRRELIGTSLNADGLDLSRYAPVASAPPPASIGWVIASILVFALTIALSATLAARWLPSAAEDVPLLSRTSRPIRLLVVVSLLALLGVQALGAVDVFVQTHIVYESADAYFGHLSLGRLVGTSHAHLFGYALLYGMVGLFACSSAAPAMLKRWLVAALCWAGPFDIASWWGMKYLTARFELLSYATALASVGASLVTLVLVARAVRAGPP